MFNFLVNFSKLFQKKEKAPKLESKRIFSSMVKAFILWGAEEEKELELETIPAYPDDVNFDEHNQREITKVMVDSMRTNASLRHPNVIIIPGGEEVDLNDWLLSE